MTSFTTPRRLRRRHTAATVALGAVAVLMSGAGASSVATPQQTGSATYRPTAVATETASAESSDPEPVDDPAIPALVPPAITPPDHEVAPSDSSVTDENRVDEHAPPLEHDSTAQPPILETPVSGLDQPADPAFEAPPTDLPEDVQPTLPAVLPAEPVAPMLPIAPVPPPAVSPTLPLLGDVALDPLPAFPPAPVPPAVPATPGAVR